VGHATYWLVRHLAVVRGIPPLSLKGKETPITAWRLLALDATPRDGDRRMASLLTGGVVSAELRGRLVDAVGGNPLFAEELIANLLEESALRLDDGHWVPIRSLTAVPAMPRIDALLAARLDRLEPAEQGIIERAAVIGVPFRAAELPALSPDIHPAEVAAELLRLVRKELLDSEPTATPPGTGEQVFRFRHNLIRDAAHRGIARFCWTWPGRGGTLASSKLPWIPMAEP
jgi:hypothetical protein